MPDKERDKVEARLRKVLDADLRQATAKLNGGELSELIRNGLRLMLGIRTTKHVEVSERPLAVPAPNATTSSFSPTSGNMQAKEKTIQLPSKPTVFTPKNQRPMS